MACFHHSCFDKGVWRCLRTGVGDRKHATLLFCAKSVNVQGNGAAKEKGMNNILVSSVCGIGIYAFLSLNAYADSLAVEIKENVKDNWEKVSEWCGEVVNLEKGMALLPEKAWLKRDRDDQREDIQELRQQIKEMLLSVDSHKLLKKIAKLDAKIADVKKKIENIREEIESSRYQCTFSEKGNSI